MGPQSVNARQIRFLGHCLRRPQGDLISRYALYHPTHVKPIPGGSKILFHEYAARLINPEMYSTATTLKNGGNVLVPCCPSVSFCKKI